MASSSSGGAPLIMVHRLNPPLLACKACREKKRRCDRNQPCANCSLRSMPCEYIHDGPSSIGRRSRQKSDRNNALPVAATPTSLPPTVVSEPSTSTSSGNVLDRLSRLEQAVFKQANPLTPSLSPANIQPEEPVAVRPPSSDSQGSMNRGKTPQPALSVAHVVERLPIISQARIMFEHFASTLHIVLGVLHIPSTRNLLEETYRSIQQGDGPNLANLLLLYGIFAGAVLAWTPELLEKLNLNKAGAKIAFQEYTEIAMSITDKPQQNLSPSVIALEGLINLTHVLNNTDGMSAKVTTLRCLCQSMARSMQIHRLDTSKSVKERQQKPYDAIEVEVMRRIWWEIVASDWLFAFAGGPQDGTYTTNPNQMKVNYPINIDDESMSAASEVPGLPLSTPTLMSGFIQRLKLARICREIADAMPTSLLECEEPSYDLVLDFDRKLQDHLKNLPTYFRLEPQSIKESEEICRQHPFVALHRIVINFSIHARICRLHRFYYLEGSTDSQYAYSRTMCIRSAHRILELRRAMDQVGDKTGYHPARFWKIMQHVYFAALTLATDVSINPDLPDVEDRKSKVLAAYRILESSKAESNALMEGVQKNMQTLLATLESRRPRRQSERSGPSSKRKRADTEHEEAFSDRHLFADSGKSSSAMISREFPSPMVEDRPFGDGMGEDMDSPMGFGMDAFGTDQLWTDFLAIAPEMEGQDWNFFLDNMYTGLQN